MSSIDLRQDRCVAKCGASSIFGLIEDRTEIPAGVLLPDYSPVAIGEHLAQLAPGFMNSQEHSLHLCFRSWIVRTPQHVILIDSCIGNHKERPDFPPFHQRKTDYLQQLAALNLSPEDVNYVCCTHLHADHCGWNTQLVDGRWVPTFPNARYIFSKRELEYWEARKAGTMGPHDGVYQDSVLPVLQAGLADIVQGDTWQVDDHLQVRSAPGHTAGHYAVHLLDGPEGAVFCGDVVHHPLQILMPEWNSAFCQLPEQAISTRRSLLERTAADGHMLFPAHFAQSGFGRVRQRAGGWQFSPIP